ncbi:hypothetical protein V3C40_06765 [Janthinobacterium sp. LS2A]|uniref:hypothetical protein n=1 Tax=Janthinobacterium sp. LS2A TaxID=3118590 RepID=UPI002F95F25F
MRSSAMVKIQFLIFNATMSFIWIQYSGAVVISSGFISMKGSWRTMKIFVITALGTSTGSLIYTGLMSDTHAFDWHRAAFVGVFCGICAAIWPGKKTDQKTP